MPEYTPFAKIPIPLWAEADQVPVDLKNAFKVIDPLLVLHADDAADRDSQYADVPAGTVVIGTDQLAVWFKKKNGSWATLWSDTGWKTVTLRNGWTNVNSGNPVAYRVLGVQCYWKGVLRPPDAMAAQTWVTIANVPAEALPAEGNQIFAASSSTGSSQITLTISANELQGWSYAANTTAWFPVPPPYIVRGA